MKHTRRILALVLALCMAVLCLAGCGSSNQTAGTASASGGQTAKTLRLAVQPSCAFIPFIIARQNGWIDEAMKEMGVDVVWTDFESGPPMNESFAAGQQDIGVIGDVPAVSAVAGGQKNVYIAAERGGTFIAVLVKDDSGINSVADLKGKKLGLTIGSTTQNFIEKLLSKNGLNIDSDVELINITVGDAQVVLMNGDVDAVAIWEPSVSRLNALDGVHILADGGDAGFSGMNLVFARKEFVDQNPDIVKAFLEQYWRASKAFEEHPEDYIDMLAEYFSLDKSLVAQAASKCEFVLAFGDEEVAALQDTVTFLVKLGRIANEFDIKEFVAGDIAAEIVAAS